MAFRFLQVDVHVLVGRCCEGGEREFAVFRAAWHPYLEAGLALVSGDWKTIEGLYEPIYAEYRQIVSKPIKPGVDYETYLLAVGYAHLAEKIGDRSLRQLLEQMFGSVPQTFSRHEVNILVLYAVLKAPDGCVSPLLHACCPAHETMWLLHRMVIARQSAGLQALPQCVQSLKRALSGVLR